MPADAAGARITSISGTPNLRLKQGLQAIAGTGGQSPGDRAARFEGPFPEIVTAIYAPAPKGAHHEHPLGGGPAGAHDVWRVLERALVARKGDAS